MTNEQMYTRVEKEVLGLKKQLQLGIKKSEKYKRILNGINTKIKEIQVKINEGEQTLKNLKNVLNKQ
jgi:peptidoglycan hydrolase CwlO-like protein